MKLKRYTSAVLALLILLGAVRAAAEERQQVRIAVIDTGISTAAISEEHLLRGKNYVYSNYYTEDLLGHGTAVASIIVGSESAGITGVCPEAVLVPMVLYTADEDGEETPGDVDTMAQMIRDAIDIYNCDIINISSTARRKTEALEEAVRYAHDKGVLLVAAAGNSGSAVKFYPGGFESALCVGAVAEDGKSRADFSSYNQYVDILAPGVQLPVAEIDGTCKKINGTSFSAAYISGLAAKLMTEYPALTAAQVEQILCASAQDILDAGWDKHSGWGVLNVENALQYAATGQVFRDAAPTDWFFLEVNEAAERGILNGTDAVSFAPYQATTRAMLWVMLYRSEGLSASEKPESWYSDAQAWMISTGISDGSDPNAAITREQMATILWRYAKYKGMDVSAGVESVLSSYRDGSEVSGWAVDAMEWACGVGLINGSDGALLPGNAADRAQTAVILMRFLKL